MVYIFFYINIYDYLLLNIVFFILIMKHLLTIKY
jgi:hypothetical protein